MKVRSTVSAVLAVMLLGSIVIAHGGAFGPTKVPIERILPQIEARLAKNPEDAHSEYLLGRVHNGAFARSSASIAAWNPDDIYAEKDRADFGLEIPGKPMPVYSKKQPPPQNPDFLREHLTAAIKHLSRAVVLAPGEALYQLGLASVLDDSAHLAPMVDSTVIAPELLGELSETERNQTAEDLVNIQQQWSLADAAEVRLRALGYRAIPHLAPFRFDPTADRQVIVARLLSSAWRELAIVHYERAFAIAFESEGKLEFLKSSFKPYEELVSYEAAREYLRMVKSRGIHAGAESKRVAEIEAWLASLKEIQRPYAISPILLPDRSNESLQQLFDGSTAHFDLAGSGESQEWPWPTTRSSFLVWDPECSGAIQDGRQLFGSATWWMFFEDGYRALEALDANGDGWLMGEELEGLALWRDANRNGISDPGEVESLADRSVVAIATHADGIDAADGCSPVCSRGVIFSDGAARPTFDWIATACTPKP